MSKNRFSVGQRVRNDDGEGVIVAINLTRQGAVYEVKTEDGNILMSQKDLMLVVNGAAIKPSNLDSSWNGKQTEVLLQGCPPDQILSLEDRVFSDIRVTRKWFDRVEEGDIIPCHTSVKPEGFEPSEDTYPGKGEFICNLLVVGKSLFKTFEEALEASENNHFVLAGNSLEDLKELIMSIYPETALQRADEDEEDGYTVLTLEIVPEEIEE